MVRILKGKADKVNRINRASKTSRVSRVGKTDRVNRADKTIRCDTDILKNSFNSFTIINNKLI